MGYRSDVEIVFYTLDKDKLPHAVIKLWFDENYPQQDWGTVMHGEDYIRVSYEDVKWYPDYEDVHAVDAAIEAFVEAFCANDEGTDAAYESIELGEQVDDIQTRSSNYATYRLNVQREILFD